jgi:hypothetical protein
MVFFSEGLMTLGDIFSDRLQDTERMLDIAEKILALDWLIHV